MQDYLRKYFWLVGVLAVVACAFLAAKAANHFLEGAFLSDVPRANKTARSPAAKPRKAKPQTRSKIGSELARRNMFCFDCEPAEPSPDDSSSSDNPDSVPRTTLPLELVATNVSSNPTRSFATIRNKTSKSQGSYWVGGTIPEAGPVVAIAGKYVDFQNQSSKRRERLSLDTGSKSTQPKTVSTPTRPTPSRSSKKDELAQMIDEGVKKVDDTTYEIDRGLVDKVLANPMSVARGARIVPSVKNGKANGFKLYAIRPSSVYAKIGLRNGDTIHSINGFELSSPDKALEVYTKVKESSNLSVTATRRGKPITLNYTIR